jgi:hypothetical protein
VAGDNWCHPTRQIQVSPYNSLGIAPPKNRDDFVAQSYATLKQQRPDGDGSVVQFTQFTVCASIAPACIMIEVATKNNGATAVIIWKIVLDCVLTENIVASRARTYRLWVPGHNRDYSQSVT